MRVSRAALLIFALCFSVAQAQPALTRDQVIERLKNGRLPTATQSGSAYTARCVGIEIVACAGMLGDVSVTTFEAKGSKQVAMVQAAVPLVLLMKGQQAAPAIIAVFNIVSAFEPTISEKELAKVVAVGEDLMKRSAADRAMMNRTDEATVKHGSSTFVFQIGVDGLRLTAFRE